MFIKNVYEFILELQQLHSIIHISIVVNKNRNMNSVDFF
jgi:hypothetical protein